MNSNKSSMKDESYCYILINKMNNEQWTLNYAQWTITTAKWKLPLHVVCCRGITTMKNEGQQHAFWKTMQN